VPQRSVDAPSLPRADLQRCHSPALRRTDERLVLLWCQWWCLVVCLVCLWCFLGQPVVVMGVFW